MAVFIGGTKNSAAAKTALQLSYLVAQINVAMKEAYPNTSYQLRQAIGIDTSKLFVARTGIRNANDLVWVGRAANYAAKLSGPGRARVHRVHKRRPCSICSLMIRNTAAIHVDACGRNGYGRRWDRDLSIELDVAVLIDEDPDRADCTAASVGSVPRRGSVDRRGTLRRPAMHRRHEIRVHFDRDCDLVRGDHFHRVSRAAIVDRAGPYDGRDRRRVNGACALARRARHPTRLDGRTARWEAPGLTASRGVTGRRRSVMSRVRGGVFRLGPVMLLALIAVLGAWLVRCAPTVAAKPTARGARIHELLRP